MDDLAAWLDEILRADQAEAERRLGRLEDDPTAWDPDYPSGLIGEGPIQFALTRIAADRQILALHSAVHEHIEFIHGASGDDWCDTCGSVDDRPIAWPCDTLKLLALPYADRPGYRDEWRTLEP